MNLVSQGIEIFLTAKKNAQIVQLKELVRNYTHKAVPLFWFDWPYLSACVTVQKLKKVTKEKQVHTNTTKKTDHKSMNISYKAMHDMPNMVYLTVV